jgi:hypothetical protein
MFIGFVDAGAATWAFCIADVHWGCNSASNEQSTCTVTSVTSCRRDKLVSCDRRRPVTLSVLSKPRVRRVFRRGGIDDADNRPVTCSVGAATSQSA